MPIKMTGATFKSWWNADWGKAENGDDPYIEGEVIIVDGIETDEVDLDKIADTSNVNLLCGCITWGYGQNSKDIDAVIHCRRWIKAQNIQTVLVEVHKDNMADFRDTLKGMKGVKIL